LFTILLSGLNMRKEAFIASLLCLLMFAGIASAGSTSPCPVEDRYTARVYLTGTIQLGWYNWTSETCETYNLTGFEANFTAMVPTEITPGQYNNATFEGYARVDNVSIEFKGGIRVNATCPGFMVSFAVPNNWPQVPMGLFEACGTVKTTITKTTLPSLQYTWVHVVGPVMQYGNEPAMGWLNAHAMITNVTQLAKAHVFWMPMPKFTPGSWPELTNVTYSFYHASLINASIVAVNYTGYDFYVKGLWTVCNVTFIYSGEKFEHCEETTTVVRQNATGELKVSPLNFTVSLAGFNDVKGLVWRLDIWHWTILEWNLDGDVSGPNNGQPDGKVDIWDLVAVAKHIGMTPGFGQGIHDLQDVEQYDVNFDCHVDVYSLVTVANEIGS
jgi:hypothetical protein